MSSLELVRERGAPDRNASKAGSEEAVVNRVVRFVEEQAHEYHDEFVRRCEKNYRGYRGIIEPDRDRPDWQSQLYPKYGLQLIETITANLIDDRLDFDIRPYPMVGSTDVETLKTRVRGAKVLEQLLKIEHELDHLDEKQRPWVMQAAITGLTVAKTYWHYKTGDVKKTVRANRTVLDEQGNVVGMVPTFEERTEKEVLDDRSCIEIVDVRDFFWPSAATSLDRANEIVHRVWMTPDEVEMLEAQGVYENGTLDRLKDTRRVGEQEGVNERENVLFDVMRTKGMIEVLEYWSGNEVITVGNRQVLMRHKQNPFHHGEKPFVVTSTMPDLFRIPGISDMELITDIQRMIWQLSNQQLDNVTMLANAIVLIASDVEDPDDYVFAPLERWVMDAPDQVKILEINPMPAQIASESIQRLMADMQNVTGGMPFMAGVSGASMDQKTATGVSIVTTLAQKRLQSKKQNFTWALGRIVEQQISLMQQFLRHDTLVPRIGQDGTAIFEQIFPDEIQGRFIVYVRAQTESILRQERRAEAQALVQMFVQLAPVAAAMGAPLNARAFLEELLEAFDVGDPDYYFSQQPQPAMNAAMGAAGGQGGGPPAPPGQMNAGTTAATAIDASSPSTSGGQTMSGEGAMQRLGAAGGGAQGVATTT